MEYIMKSILVLLLFVSQSAMSHGNEFHKDDSSVQSTTNDKDRINQEISKKYVENVEKIFVTKCFDCHSDNTRFPWYYSLPVVKQLIDHDIAEAKRHLDMNGGFPFKSHSTPLNDLKEIKENIMDGDMPPFRYRIMHKNSSVTDDEKAIIEKWVNESVELIESSEKK